MSGVKLHFNCPVVLALLFFCCGGSLCQTAKPPSASPSTVPEAPPSSANAKPAPASSTKPSPKVTSAPAEKTRWTLRQRQALDILKAVEGEVGRFSPETQTYLLQEIAHCYKELDRAKQVEVLKAALQAATTMPEGEYRNQQERQIVRELSQAGAAGLESLQNAADANVRELVSQLLVKQDIYRGRLVAAAQRLSQWDSALAFPYGYAKDVITSLNAQQSGERQAVFSSAVAAYRVAKMNVGPESGMSELILGTYDDLPLAMVVEAIDLLLSKVAKAEQEMPDHLSVTIAGSKGQASFSSLYDFELFQLLPVLDKLDPAKGEALRRDHSTVAAMNSKYPNGRSSISPDNKNMSMMFGASDDQGPPPGSPPEMTAQRQMADAVVESASEDLEGAIAGTQNLNNTVASDYAMMTLRCRALEKIAEMEVGRKNIVGAMTAVKALASASQDLPALARAHYLVRAAALSAQSNDPQAARQYLGRATKAASELYQQDAFGDPPNTAPKSVWPSTGVWKGTLVVAEHVDPAYASQELAALPDPEIEAVSSVAIAGVLLGQEPGLLSISIQKKDGPQMDMTFDVPWWSGGTN
jgi:hypothetical protein